MWWASDSSRGEQLLRRNVKRFRGELVFKAYRPLYHSTLGSMVIKRSLGCCQTRRRAPDLTGLHAPFIYATDLCVTVLFAAGGGHAIARRRTRLYPVCAPSTRGQIQGCYYKTFFCHTTHRNENSPLSGTFFFFFITLQPRVEWYTRL